jgi:hypothetical protein
MTLMGLIIAQQLSGTPDTPSLATAEHKMFPQSVLEGLGDDADHSSQLSSLSKVLATRANERAGAIECA